MYLTKADLTTNISPDVAALLSRFSDTIIDAHLVTAVSTIQTYLASRYEISIELAKTGADRYSLLLNMAKDIAIYSLYSNAETIPQLRVKRYDDAMALLKSLAKGEGALVGVPATILTPEAAAAGDILFGSSPRRPSYNS